MSTGGLGMKIRAGGAYVTLGVNDKLSAGLTMAERKLQAFGQRVGALGTKLATASIAVMGPNVMAAKTFAGFEQSMAKVQAIITPTKEEFTALWQEAKRLGAETQFTASDAARGMATFAQANFKTNQILAAMLPTLDLAAAGEMDVAEAADIAAQIMNSMGISADDIGTAIDVLTKATQTANTDLRQLGYAFTYAGAIASSAGASFEEATVFLQMMSNAGIKADMAGTTLRGALLALTSPSQMARERLNELGVDVDNLQGNFVSLSEVIRQFESKMGGMGTAERMRFLGDIFDNRQASGFAKAVVNGSEMFRQMEKSLYNSTGAARKFASTLMGTLQGSWDYVTSAFEGLQISIGETINLLSRNFLAGLTDAIGMLDQFIQKNREFIPNLLMIAAATGAVGVALLGLSIIFSTVATVIAPFTFAVSAVIGTVTTLASLVASLFTPWGMAIALIGVATLSLVDFGAIIAQVTNAVTDWGRWMGAIFNYAMKGIQDAIAVGDVTLAFEIMMAGMKYAAIKTLQSIAYAFDSTIGGIVTRVAWLSKQVQLLISSLKFVHWLFSGAMATVIGLPMGVDPTAEYRAQYNDLVAERASIVGMDPENLGATVANALDASAAADELVKLRKEAEDAAYIAKNNAAGPAALGPAREMPALRTPDGVIPALEAAKAEEARKQIQDAISFAAVGSFGGQFLDRMKQGAKSATDKIADNTKKMLEEQKETNDHLSNMDGLSFAP